MSRHTLRRLSEYLILEEDSIDDRLGLIGFLDDAFILDRAVAAIEPAREPRLRLIEAAGTAGAWPRPRCPPIKATRCRCSGTS